jgi:hypothetical protein
MDPNQTGPNYGDAIASIESGGNYGVLGPATKGGDRAYGKYQIMGTNIAPWSKEILGTSLTPQEFLGNPEAQDAIFQGKFNQYVNKYGPEGAARAWFAGPGGMNNLNAKDVNGMTVGQYAQRFTGAMAPPLGATDVPNAPPIAGPAPTNPGAQSPSLGASPTQTQQLQAAGGNGGNAPQAQPISGPQAPPFQLRMAQPFRPQVNMQYLQRAMQNFPALLRGYLG